jgi:crotonobetainyl-CoA:carnitine CoA-transferase CaiB-like acyl-CoA transferase
VLDGLRVLDLTRLLPGGYCSLLLADLGARVVKVEAPGRGDPLRQLPGGDLYFNLLHGGKRSVALRLNHPAGRGALLQLVRTSDVLLEGFRPGVMERLEIGWESLNRVNPRLVYCAITGYGSAGAMRNRAGHDLNYLARSGALALMPAASGTPVIPGLQVADLAGGMSAAVACLAALLQRERTGAGRRLEVSMTDVMQSWAALPLAAARSGGGGMELTGKLPCYHVYQVKDGYLTVAALEPAFWLNFCRAIGREDLGGRQADPAAVEEVARVLQPGTRAEWMAHFGDGDVCVEPCLEVQEAPVQKAASRAPGLGEHTVEVLTEAGCSLAEIEALLKIEPA